MGERFVTKVERLKDLTNLLLNYPDGLTKAEIARRLGINRSTVPEDLEDLSRLEPVWEPIDEKLWSIRRDNYRPKVALSLNECMALHLAVRLLTTRTDKHYPHAASALRELAKAIGVLAPPISEHMLKSAEMLEANHRQHQPIFIQNLTRLTQAWSKQKRVKIMHEKDGKIHEYLFDIYFIEPYAVGRTIHVIGRRTPPDEIRTFKLERIHTVEELNEAYDIPETFDPREKLKSAWGIWYTDKEPVRIELKFSTNVAKRVQETQWHHNQKTKPQDDGSLLWYADVDEWREMLPWIRGWGADCEVIAPLKLRREIEREIINMAQAYKIELQTLSVDEDDDDYDSQWFKKMSGGS